MNTDVGRAQIGQWYLHCDKGEMFHVTGLDESSRTIEIQTFDGEIDEIDEDGWTALPLQLAEASEDWTGPVDAVDVDDLGYSETEMTAKDWEEPLQPLRTAREEWENPSDEESDSEGEESEFEGAAALREELALDDSVTRELLR